MKKILFPILMLLTCCSFCYAQHLTYSTFMKVVNKTERASEFNDAIGAYGYNYGGMYVENKNSESETQYAYWVKNCHLIESTNTVEWQTGIDRSFFVIVYKPSNNIPRWFKYWFHSKSAYKSFISTAKQNGFVFKNDGIDNSYIFTYYERVNKTKQQKECLKMIEYSKPEYIVMYWKESL